MIDYYNNNLKFQDLGFIQILYTLSNFIHKIHNKNEKYKNINGYTLSFYIL